MCSPLLQEKVWFEKNAYEEAEKQYYEKLTKVDGLEALAKNNNIELNNRVNALEKENSDLKKLLNDLQELVKKMDSRVKYLETSTPKAPSGSPAPAAPKPTPAAAKPAKEEEEDDDDVDLFGSDSEEEESEDAKRVKEARLAAYHAKKSKKPVLIAKSNIILDVKPWDDETDMKALEAEVRKIEIDGLLWGASKLVPLAYGIHKLQISCVVEDDKVSIDLLQETIESIEDFVQSVDIAAFNKV